MAALSSGMPLYTIHIARNPPLIIHITSEYSCSHGPQPPTANPQMPEATRPRATSRPPSARRARDETIVIHPQLRVSSLESVLRGSAPVGHS